MCRFFAPEICNNAILSSAISVIYNNTPLYAEGEMDVTYAKEFEKGTFDSFRAGKANALAVKMIREAVNHPDLYNPVLIYGQAGTGKTHLLHAMADEMLQAHPDWHVELIHCADLTNQLISHIMDGKTKEFRDFFMQVDAILVDDIHILSGKQATQEEMLRVLDVLMCNGKQVVMTADRHPRQILAVQDQLRSRFHGGLLLELYAPDVPVYGKGLFDMQFFYDNIDKFKKVYSFGRLFTMSICIFRSLVSPVATVCHVVAIVVTL